MGEIIEKQGYRIVVYNLIDRFVLITNENISTANEFMLEHNFTKIQLNYTAGFTQESTEFLKSYEFVDAIMIIPNNNINISGIHYLKNVKDLRISHELKQGIQFSLFPFLESCRVFWNDKHKDLENIMTLKKLSLSKFRFGNLKNLGGLTNLEELEIVISPLTSLVGIDAFKKMTNLSLAYNTKLQSLTGIETLSETLVDLDIEACKAIRTINELSALVNLRKLGINNCGEIESIKPVAKLTKLNRFDFWESTKILDGDMSPCIGIETVAYQNRRHYNYRNEEIDEINSRKIK